MNSEQTQIGAGSPSPSTPLLAFSVTTDCAEASVLVWARTRAEAKHLGMCSLWLDGCDWTDLRTKREPKADGLRDTPQAMDDDCGEADMRLLRSLGWHEVDGHDEPCPQCKLHEWRKLPESRITADTGLCAGCQANEQVEARL